MVAGPTVPEDDEIEASQGSLIRIDGELHHVLALLDQRVLMAHVATGRLYIAPDEIGIVGLPTKKRVRELVATGRATLVDCVDHPVEAEESTPRKRREIEKINAQCDLLSEAGISNGSKAMSIFLHANWRGHLIDRFGPHSPVDTLKRWRTLRSRKPQQTQP